MRLIGFQLTTIKPKTHDAHKKYVRNSFRDCTLKMIEEQLGNYLRNVYVATRVSGMLYQSCTQEQKLHKGSFTVLFSCYKHKT